MADILNAREAALKALIEWRAHGAWPDRWLKKALDGMSAEDAALTTAIVYGVMQQRELLDFYIASFSSVKLKRIMPQVLDVLRLGAYQLIFMDKIPAFAAINESVSLAKRHGGARAGGFVNALLRTLEREKDRLPEPDKSDFLRYLSIRYSHPEPLIQRFIGIFGEEEAEKLLAANNAPAPLTARVNKLKTSTDELISQIKSEACAHEYLPDALTLSSARAAAGMYESGMMNIMDAASQLCVHALAPRQGADLLDLCAAPGGKTLMAAQIMQGRGSIRARDIHAGKIEQLVRSAQAFGVGALIEARCADAAMYDARMHESADFIICDVPCSGYGIIRKKPDIRYKDPAGAAQLPELQLKIAQNAAKYLRRSGEMVYSTCTVLPEENEQIIQKLMQSDSSLALESFTLPRFGEIAKGMLTLLPHLHGTDGFFIAKLRKEF